MTDEKWPFFPDDRQHNFDPALAREEIETLRAEVKRLNHYVELAGRSMAQSHRLQAEVARLRAALAEVAKGEGPFSRDRFTHAANCVENMKSIAEKALRDSADQNFPADSHPQGG